MTYLRPSWTHSSLGLLLVCVFVLGAAAPVAAQDLSNLTGISTLTGNCERLVASGNDFSDHCDGRIVQSVYSTGRTGFTVLVGDKGTAFTFSGIEGAKPDADSQLQSVDHVILNLNIQGVEPTSTEVTGGCAYSNPYLGPMTISCQATDAKGEAFLLQFRTDGSEPSITDTSGASDAGVTTNAYRTFQVGNWTGGPLEGDPDKGCLMSFDVKGNAMLMVYANGNEAFEISIFDDGWSFAEGAVVNGELLFDGTAFPLASITARNDKVLTLHGGSEEESYQAAFTSSSELVFRLGRQQISTNLLGSSAATDRLWTCVSG